MRCQPLLSCIAACFRQRLRDFRNMLWLQTSAAFRPKAVLRPTPRLNVSLAATITASGGALVIFALFLIHSLVCFLQQCSQITAPASPCFTGGNIDSLLLERLPNRFHFLHEFALRNARNENDKFIPANAKCLLGKYGIDLFCGIL